MPGTDPGEAMTVIMGELPDLPHLAELPARGPGSDLVGRTAALLVDLPVETTARGWRLAERRGRDVRRADGLLSADLDAAEEAAQGYAGPFKVQACGPWTLAAALELTRSIEPVLADEGALRDLTASLAEGIAAHVAAVRRRLPGAEIIVQVDEPALPGVLAGSIPTASGLRRLPAVDEPAVSGGLRLVLAATGAPSVVHCCAAPVPFGCLATAGAAAVAFDLSVLRRGDEDAVGEVAEAGLGLLAGAVPPVPDPVAERGRDPVDLARQTARDVIALWRRIGLPAGRLPGQVVLTPGCGLAAATPASAVAALSRCRTAARAIPELIEEGAI